LPSNVIAWDLREVLGVTAGVDLAGLRVSHHAVAAHIGNLAQEHVRRATPEAISPCITPRQPIKIEADKAHGSWLCTPRTPHRCHLTSNSTELHIPASLHISQHIAASAD